MDWSTSLILDRATRLLGELSAIPRMTVCSSLSPETRDLLTEAGGNITETGRGLKLSPGGLAASADSDHDFCCPPVVDSSTWLGVVGGIAVVTFFLRMQITGGGKRRRRRAVHDTEDIRGKNYAKYHHLIIHFKRRIQSTKK